MSPDQALFVASAVNQLAWAVTGLAVAVMVASVVMAVGYWYEAKTWRDRDEP